MRLLHLSRFALDLIPFSVVRHGLNEVRDDRLSPAIVRRDTNFVVEAFPRSANTFCYYYLQLTFPTASIAHHVHSWQQFLLAKLYNVPSFLLIRRPDDAVSSLMTKRPVLSVTVAYLDYALSNMLAARLAEHIVRFEDVTDEQFLSRLADGIHERLQLPRRKVDLSEVRQLMRERTDHKNTVTTPLNPEQLSISARLARRAALRTYDNIQRRAARQLRSPA